MTMKFLGVAAIAAAAGTAVAWLATVPVAGQQTPSAPTKATVAAPLKMASAVTVPAENPNEPKGKPAPRNAADGHADLNGVWSFRTATPVERQPEFGTKLFLTKQEAAEFARRQ